MILNRTSLGTHWSSVWAYVLSPPVAKRKQVMLKKIPFFMALDSLCYDRCLEKVHR